MAEKKVYLISSGFYSDYRVWAAYSTRYRAKKALEVFLKDDPDCGIETRDLDVVPRIVRQYRVTVDYSGEEGVG